MTRTLKHIRELARRGYASIETTRALTRWLSEGVMELRATREETMRLRVELREARETR